MKKGIALLIIITILSGGFEPVFAYNGFPSVTPADGVSRDSISRDSVSESWVKQGVSENEVGQEIQGNKWYGLSWSINSDGLLRITGESTLIPDVSDDPFHPKDEIPWLNSSFSKVLIENCKIKGSMGYWFFQCGGLTDFNAKNVDTSQVTTMKRMFEDCQNLSTANVKGFNTANVTNLSKMFYNCRKLESVDVTHFNTKKTTDISNMFAKCHLLSELDVKGFQTEQVQDFTGMFWECRALSSLDLRKFSTNSATYLHGMFYGCRKLKNLDLSSFSTGKVFDMKLMFQDCTALETLDLSSFDMSAETCITGSSKGLFLPEACPLKSIKTPKNLKKTVLLPHKMYDENGSKYASLPLNQSTSMTWMKTRPGVFGEVTTQITNQDLKITSIIKTNDVTRVTATIQEQLKDGSIVSSDCSLSQKDGKWEGNHALKETMISADITIHAWDKDGDATDSETSTVRRDSDNYLIDKKEAEKRPGGAAKNGYVTVKLPQKGFSFTGAQIQPEVTAKYTYTSYADSDQREGAVKTVSLVRNRDYTLSYQNNINVGTGTVKLTGMGDYSGSYSVNFTIRQKSIVNAKIEPVIDVVCKAGEAYWPRISREIHVMDGNYQIPYEDLEVQCFVKGKEVKSLQGSGEKQEVTVRVKGKRNYRGTTKGTQKFLILPENTKKIHIFDAVTVKLDNGKRNIYNGKRQKPSFRITDKTGKKLKSSNYKVHYENNINSGEGSISFLGRNEFYGAYTLNFTIEKRNLSETQVKALSRLSFSDSMDQVKPIVKYKGKYLRESVDYQVNTKSIREVTFLGTRMKQVTFTLHALDGGNFTGDKEVKCTVIPRRINNRLSIKAYCPETALGGNGEACPQPIVTDKGVQLQLGRDYEILSYRDNKRPGKGKVVIGGKGNYSGKRTITFKINRN